jgi:3-isopropylmalate dehydrogenase
MLRYSLNQEEAATAIEAAVEQVLAQGYRTRELREPGTERVGTQRMGDLIARAVGKA